MPLKNKYLKYSPEITLEIFILICNKLMNNGWTIYNNQSIKEVYGYLKKEKEWIGIKHDKSKVFMQYQTIKTQTETTVQEILGYDPFVKKQPEPFEKWSVGSYVVCIERYTNKFDIGNIGKIDAGAYSAGSSCVDVSKSVGYPCMPFKKCCQWFATKSEAEEFAKTLIEPVKEPIKQAVHCKTQEEWDFVLSKFNPISLAKNKFLDYKENSVIVTVDFDSNVGRFGHLIHHKHQILSFQEWCDLNGYKMEFNQKFKVIPDTSEKYEISRSGIIRNISTKKELTTSLSTRGYLKVNLWLNDKNNSPKVHRLLAKTFLENPYNLESINHKDGNKLNNNLDNLEWCTSQENHEHYKNTVGTFNSDLEREEILDIYFNFNKYGEQKQAAIKYGVSEGCISLIKSGVSFKHIIDSATPEEINSHLTGIGQIPVGEPLNTGIEPNKDGMFHCVSINRGSNPLCEFTSISINGEEIYNKNKFNILKTTKTIKF